MHISNRVNIYLLSFLTSYSIVWSQHLECPAEEWIVGSNVTLMCYLPKDTYPGQCDANTFTGDVTFRRDPLIASDQNTCTLAVTTTCTSFSPNECSCESGNSTHFALQYTFTVDTSYAGTWVCSVTCKNGLTNRLTYRGVNCDSRTPVTTTVLPPTTSPATTESTTPASTRDCAFGVLFNCNDSGGRWGFILFIVIISILCLAILVIGICYVFFRKQTEKVLGPIYRCIDRCRGKKSPEPNKPGPNRDEGTSLAKPTNPNRCRGKKSPEPNKPGPNRDEGTSLAKPTNPNSTKRGKQTAEKSDMNELRDIPSSPDQDERSHPAKRSRDLPQPGAGGEGQGNVTHSSTHRSLLPVQAVTPLPSVERNSYAESRKLPLPSIDSKDAH